MRILSTGKAVLHMQEREARGKTGRACVLEDNAEEYTYRLYENGARIASRALEGLTVALPDVFPQG